LFCRLSPCALQRGLFERHKLLFALMLTNKILVSAGKVKPQDVDILLKGGGALDITSVGVLISIITHA
jgi:dynein heavy chain